MKNNIKLTTKDFINRAISIHGKDYDYSNVIYNGMHKNIVIICPIHGEFEQTPHSHLRGGGCPLCAREKKSKRLTKTKDDFILKANKIHGFKYDYSKIEYRNLLTKVVIVCPIHGDFLQVPYSHLHGHGCPKCCFDENSNRKRRTKEDFIKKAISIHGDDKYIYNKVKYVRNNAKVCITCKKHGDFWQQAGAHLSGSGCPMCFEEKRGKSKILPFEDFKISSNIIHNGKYDYSLITNNNYIDTKHKVPIICPQHGVFWQIPKIHKNGCGCPHCPPSIISVGEKIVSNVLKKYNIHFIPQYKIKNDNLICANKAFFVDFYLPSYNAIIEYNGEQHYRPSSFFGGTNSFEKQQNRDVSLRLYCNEHKIKLIEIPYSEVANIETILVNVLNIVKNKQMFAYSK